MASSTPVTQSPDSKQAVELAENMAKSQAIHRAAQLGGGRKSVTDWLMKIPNIEGAKTATRILQYMCSSEDAPFIIGMKMTAAHITNFIANARTHGPAADIPDEAEAAKSWANPWIMSLVTQAKEEHEQLTKALTSARALFTSTTDEAR